MNKKLGIEIGSTLIARASYTANKNGKLFSLFSAGTVPFRKVTKTSERLIVSKSVFVNTVVQPCKSEAKEPKNPGDYALSAAIKVLS